MIYLNIIVHYTISILAADHCSQHFNSVHLSPWVFCPATVQSFSSCMVKRTRIVYIDWYVWYVIACITILSALALFGGLERTSQWQKKKCFPANRMNLKILLLHDWLRLMTRKIFRILSHLRVWTNYQATDDRDGTVPPHYCREYSIVLLQVL